MGVVIACVVGVVGVGVAVDGHLVAYVVVGAGVGVSKVAGVCRGCVCVFGGVAIVVVGFVVDIGVGAVVDVVVFVHMAGAGAAVDGVVGCVVDFGVRCCALGFWCCG